MQVLGSASFPFFSTSASMVSACHCLSNGEETAVFSNCRFLDPFFESNEIGFCIFISKSLRKNLYYKSEITILCVHGLQIVCFGTYRAYDVIVCEQTIIGKFYVVCWWSTHSFSTVQYSCTKKALLILRFTYWKSVVCSASLDYAKRYRP